MIIDPRRASGMRDYLPKDMIPRQKMFDTIRKTFELFGFAPLDTPGLELEEVLTGGDPDFNKQIYRASLQGAAEERGLALRFDLTVPLARVIAEYGSQIEKPFKRYQMGKVWRGERAQAGRFREFVQFDADTVGSNKTESDAEIIALMFSTMSALGFSNFIIKVNSRKILNGLPAFAGFDKALLQDVLRCIDKMDKIAWEGVVLELEGLGLSSVQIKLIEELVDLGTKNSDNLLEKIESLMQNSDTALDGVRELKEITKHLEALGVPSEKWTIDLSVARGLGYYTGTVFETVLTDLPEIGSVFSGGRYDDLVSRFSSANIPAVGASIGVDRLFAAMEKISMVKQEVSVAKVFILNFDPECLYEVQSVARDLRQQQIPVEIYLGNEGSFKSQLAYAAKQGFKIVIILGSDEKKKGIVQIKNMLARTQTPNAVSEVAKTVKSILEA